MNNINPSQSQLEQQGQKAGTLVSSDAENQGQEIQNPKNADVYGGGQKLSLFEKIGCKWAKPIIDELIAKSNGIEQKLEYAKNRLKYYDSRYDSLKSKIENWEGEISSLSDDVDLNKTTGDSVLASTDYDGSKLETDTHQVNVIPENKPEESGETNPVVSNPKNDGQKLSLREKIGCKWAKRILNDLEAKSNEIDKALKDKEQCLIDSEQRCTVLEKCLDVVTALQAKIEDSAKQLKDSIGDNSKLEKVKSDALIKVAQLEAQLKREIKEAEDKVNSALKNAADMETANILRKLNARFNGLNADTVDEALNKIAAKEKRLNNLNDEAERKAKLAENSRIAAESLVEEARSEAADRVAEIEASDKGQLIVQLESVRNELKEKIENININTLTIQNQEDQIGELLRKIADVKADLHNREEAIANGKVERDNLLASHAAEMRRLEDESKSKITALEEKQSKEIQGVEDKHKKEIESLNISHKNALDYLETEHTNRIEAIREKHTAETKKIVDQKDSEMKEQKEKYERKLSETVSEYVDKLSSAKSEYEISIKSQKEEASREKERLEGDIRDCQATISGLEQTLGSESSALRSSTLEFASRLYTLLSNEDIMAACNDVFKSKVEEKLQDLRVDSKFMLSELTSLPDTRTPSQWKNALLDYLMSQLSNESSLINRLLKYRTLSNVPFMIDGKRDNGLYFIRGNMKRASEYIYALLAQCGIVPVLPALFVENENDDQYEVKGQFNDIESFCPGSINEHVSHIERSASGLEKLIVGVTRVGYVINGEYKIKAQIIIR